MRDESDAFHGFLHGSKAILTGLTGLAVQALALLARVRERADALPRWSRAVHYFDETQSVTAVVRELPLWFACDHGFNLSAV